MTRMRLHCFPHSPYSRKAIFALFERGIEVDIVVVAPFDAEAKARLATLDPLATVPYLEVGPAEGISDSSLVVELADVERPSGAPFVPVEPRAALRARALDALADTLLSATAYLAWAPRKTTGERNDAKIASTRQQVDRILARLEETLADGRQLIGGDHVSLPDISFCAAIAALIADGSIDGLASFPAVERWHARMTARPAWQRILEVSATVPRPF